MRRAVLFVFLLVGCDLSAAPNDGDACTDDGDCDSELCHAGTCGGSLCLCRVDSLISGCVETEPRTDPDDCVEGWHCDPGGSAGRCKLTCGDCPKLWVCDEDEGYCKYDLGALPPPTVTISPTDIEELVPDEAVTLRAVASSDNGAIVRTEWDLGDGTSASGDTVTHAYASPGSKEVVLLVEDAAGRTASERRRIDVCRGPGAACQRVGWGDLCCAGERCQDGPSGATCAP